MKKILFLIPLFLILMFPLMSGEPVQRIFYNFTHPEGVGGNPHLIWNDGTGSSGVCQMGTFPEPNLTSVNLSDYILFDEALPIGLMNAFDFRANLTNLTMIQTNVNGQNTDQSFAFSTWVKRSAPSINVCFTEWLSPECYISQVEYLLGFENKYEDGEAYLLFKLDDFVYHAEDNTPTYKLNKLIFEFGKYNTAFTTCSSNSWSDTDSDWHQVGFIYNENNRVSGDLVKLFIDGSLVANCSNTGLTGTFSEVERLLMGSANVNDVQVYSNVVMTPPAYTSDAFEYRISNVNYFNSLISDSLMQTMYEISYFNESAPIRTLDFQDVEIGTFIAYSINGYYENYDTFNVSWYDNTLNTTIYMTRDIGQSAIIIEGDIRVTLNGVINPDDILFRIDKLIYNDTVDFTVRAINDKGYDEQTFRVTLLEFIPDEPLPEEVPSFISQTINFLGDIFPNKERLSLRQRYSYVFLSMLVLTLILLLAGFNGDTNSVDNLMFYITIFANFILFFFFIAIGYIGIIALITMLLVASAVIYFFRRGG